MIATAGVSSPTRTVQSGPTIEPSPVPLPPLAARLVAVIALAKVVFHLATATLHLAPRRMGNLRRVQQV